MSNQSNRGTGKKKITYMKIVSVRVKFIAAVVAALVISPIIAKWLNDAINIVTQLEGQFAVYISTVINLVVVTGIIYILTKKMIISPLNKIIDVTYKVAKGNLTVGLDIKSKDEVGLLARNCNLMIENLRELLDKTQHSSGEVSLSSRELNSAAEEITQAIKQIAVGAEELSSGVDTTNKSVIETKEAIAKLSRGLADSGQKAQEAVRDVAPMGNALEEGRLIVKETIDKMKQVNTKVVASSQLVQALEQKSTDIGKIMETIGTISNQTNLLALNAAIEAARAGEHGRGFAVVAEEVRKLAEETQLAAEEVSELIRSVQEEIGNTGVMMQESLREVDQGVAVVSKTETVFSKISENVSTTSDNVVRIADIIKEQLPLAQTVTTAMDQVEQVMENVSDIAQNAAGSTQKCLASSQEIKAAAEKLVEMSEKLQEDIKLFKVS